MKSIKYHMIAMTLGLGALGVLFVSSMGTAANADILDKIKADGKFTVATEARFPPFEYVKDGEIIGYSADIMKHIMKALPGVELERLDLPFQGILAGLEAGKYPFIVTSLTATKERNDRYALTVPIADATYAIVKRKGDDSIVSPTDLGGKIIGVQAGSSTLKGVEALAEELKASGKPAAGIKTYTDNNEAYADLAAGRVHVVANNLPNLLALQAKRAEAFEVIMETFGPKRYFVWAGRKDADSKALISFMNEQILLLNRSGVLAELQEKWIGGSVDLPETLPPLSQ